MTSRESELITTGIHRNGQHWAKAYDVEGVGDTPDRAREDLQDRLREKADAMVELAEAMMMEGAE